LTFGIIPESRSLSAGIPILHQCLTDRLGITMYECIPLALNILQVLPDWRVAELVKIIAVPDAKQYAVQTVQARPNGPISI